MVPAMKHRRAIKKDEVLGLRLPRADKERLEVAARLERRNPSDLAWVLIADGIDRVLGRHAKQNPYPNEAR